MCSVCRCKEGQRLPDSMTFVCMSLPGRAKQRMTRNKKLTQKEIDNVEADDRENQQCIR